MKPMFIEDSSFFDVFLQSWGFVFEHFRGICACVTDQSTNSEEYTKFEHVFLDLLVRSFRLLYFKQSFIRFTFS